MVATYAPYPWGTTPYDPKPYYPPYTIPNWGPIIASQGPGPASASAATGAGQAGQLTPQGWFDDVVSVVTKVAPIVISLLATSPSGAAMRPASAAPGGQAGQLTPQGWFDDITSIVDTVIKVGGALGVFNVGPNGSGLQTASTAASPALTPQGWFDDVVSVVTKVAPIVISLLATSPSGAAMRPAPASAQPSGQLSAQGWTDDLTSIVNTVLQVGGALGLFNAPAAGRPAMPARPVN